MSCEQYRRMMIDNEDDARDSAAGRELERHLADCAECRRERLRLQRSLAVFEAMGRGEEAIELAPGLAERVAARALAVRKPSRMRALLAAGFIALALLSALWAGYALRPLVSGPDRTASVDLVSPDALSLRADGLGLEIANDRFVLRTHDKEGNKGIDLRF